MAYWVFVVLVLIAVTAVLLVPRYRLKRAIAATTVPQFDSHKVNLI